MAQLIAVVSFGLILSVLLSGYYALTSTRRTVRERIDRYVNSPVADGPESVTPTPDIGRWRLAVRHWGKYFELSQWSRVMEQKLVQAGLPLRGGEFAVICLMLVFSGLIVTFIGSGGKILPSLAGGIIGHLLPVFFVRVRIGRRATAFNNQLGDALTLIANSLRTGYSFLQAAEAVSREMPAPIAPEFGRTIKEINLGVTTEEAMTNLARRIASADLDLAVTAVLIQRQIGGNLAEILDNIAGTIRARAKLRGEVKALTAQGRLSGWIVSLLPVAMALVMYVLNPNYLLVLVSHPAGQMMLAAGLASQALGIFLIRKIVNIEL